MGDCNFDLLNNATNNNTFDFLNTIVESGFLPLIHQPTRTTETLQEHLLTISFQIFLNMKLKVEIYNYKISDHPPLFALVKRSVHVNKTLKYYNCMIIKTLKIYFWQIFPLNTGQI